MKGRSRTPLRALPQGQLTQHGGTDRARAKEGWLRGRAGTVLVEDRSLDEPWGAAGGKARGHAPSIGNAAEALARKGGRQLEPRALARSRGGPKGSQAVGKLHTTQESAALQKAKRTAGKVLRQKRATSVRPHRKTFQAPG